MNKGDIIDSMVGGVVKKLKEKMLFIVRIKEKLLIHLLIVELMKKKI